MASLAEADGRFADLTEDELQSIIDGKDSKQTKAVISKSVVVLKAYCKNKGYTDFSLIESSSAADLTALFRKFYAEVRTQSGTFYAKKSMQTIRYGLQKHFNKLRNIDIVNDSAFKSANEMFASMLVKLKDVGKGSVTHKAPIGPEDLAKIRASDSLCTATPAGLQNKVFVDLMLHMSQRGRENLREMERDEFVIKTDATNIRYVIRARDRRTKNHSGTSDDAVSHAGVMYETPADPQNCPVRSYEQYVSRLNPMSNAFWQHPKELGKVNDSQLWYDNAPVGKNKLYSKMKDISLQAKTSQVYTNHCLRATNVTVLDEAGFEARDIMSVTGHRSEASIRSYSRTGLSKKRKMSAAISSNAYATEGQNAYATEGQNIDLLVSNQENVVSVGLGLQQSAASKPKPSPSVESTSRPSPRSRPIGTSGSTSTSTMNAVEHDPGLVDAAEFAILTNSQEDNILNELTNSPGAGFGLNIGVSRQFTQKASTASFQFHNCNVNIYNN